MTLASTVADGRRSSFAGRTKSPGRWLLALSVVGVGLAVIAPRVPWSDLSDGVRAARDEPLALLAALALYAAAFVLRAVAWRMLLSRPPALRELVSNLHTSLFLNHLLPFKAGEVSRPLLAVQHGMAPGEAVASSIVARTLDFVCLALLAAVALPVVWDGGSAGAAWGLAAAVIGAGVIALAIVRWRGTQLGPAWFQRRVTELRTSLRAIPASKIAAAAPIVALSWALESVVLLAAAELLGLDISIRVAVGVTAFTILFQAIHFTPGGLGVYETAMTTALASASLPSSDALALAVLTHGLKFAYALLAGGAFAVGEGVFLLRGRADAPAKRASKFELLMARLWNVLNEGKPFTPVFTAAVILVLAVPRLTSVDDVAAAAVALASIVPLAVVFYRFDFPLKLRWALWVYLLVFVLVTRSLPLAPVVTVLAAYFGFTVVLWGTVYYHLRIGTPWSNGFRFLRLVLENPDPTSGNFLEQVPKVLLLVLLFEFSFAHGPIDALTVGAILAVAVAGSALLLHQWFFTWVPPLRQPKLAISPSGAAPGPARSSRVIVIAIDGCRADRLLEAKTPFIDGLRARGADFRAMCTVYPARTVTCFSSMLTGAGPAVHGMRSNFVPSLGIKCESVFDVLRADGRSGKIVGIAHLVDAFGERDVAPVTAVMDNDHIDHALIERAQRVLLDEGPDLLVLQLLSVDQTGHARGSYNSEYLAKIETTDRLIGGFLEWCRGRGFLDGATVILTADHGQGIGIGGHGHMSPPEILVPCIVAGAGVDAPRVDHEPRSITDIAATICGLLGVSVPGSCVGEDLLSAPRSHDGPVVFVVPARNEEARLPAVLQGIGESGVEDAVTIVVDDGSTDGTAAAARAAGALVVQHGAGKGLGAALRTGLAAARSLNPRAAIYLDADGEYNPRESARLLALILAGEADYVLGSRSRGTAVGMRLSRRVANRAFSLLLSVCAGRWISDGQTGFRAFSPRALDVAEIVHDYNYAQVLTLDLLRKRMGMREVPISYIRRTGGRSFVKADYLWRVPVGMVREMLAP